MREINYNELKKLENEVAAIKVEAAQLKEYNIKQNYLRAVARLCKSGIIEDWLALNQVTNFDYVKTCEQWNEEAHHWEKFINKKMDANGKLREGGSFIFSFNPQTTWIKHNGGFGVYRSYGACGETNMLSFGPQDVDTENCAIQWHEYNGTSVNNGPYFSKPYEIKTAIINELIGNYERYREYAYNKTKEHLLQKKADALQTKIEAVALLEEDDD